MNEAASDVKNIRARYDKFEKGVFEKKLQETQYVVKDTNKLIERIGEMTLRINSDLEKVNT